MFANLPESLGTGGREKYIMCEWSHNYDESEWSLMTSLIRRFLVPV